MTIAGLQASTRTNLTALKTLQTSLGRSQTRLATGQRYQGLLENPGAVFDARAMRTRGDDLQRIVDAYTRPRGAIEAASSGLAAVEGLIGQLEALARRMEVATPAEIGTPATPATPASGPETLVSYSKQINLDGQGNVVAGDARSVAEGAVLGPWRANEFVNGSQIKADIFTNNARAYVPHVTERASSYTNANVDNRIDRILVTATDGTTTISHRFYFGHANDVTVADLDKDYADIKNQVKGAGGPDHVYTVKHLVQGITEELGGFLRAEVTANGRVRFEAAGDFQIVLEERSPGGATATNPWDSLENLFGVVDAAGDGDVTTGLDTFEFATGTGSAQNFDISAAQDGNYDIKYDPGTRPTGGFAAITPGTPGTEATGLLAEWDALIDQIEQVVADSGFDGLNLLTGGDSIQLSERSEAARLSLRGLSATIAGLGLSRSDADFSNPAAIADRLAELRGAGDRIGTMSAVLASASAVLDAREDFSLDLKAILEDGADDLTLADPNEEGARMLAAQTRIDLAASALAIASQSRPFLLQHYERYGFGP